MSQEYLLDENLYEIIRITFACTKFIVYIC